MPSSPRDRIGEVYGKLTVVRASERRTKAGNVYWWCRCSCGAEREVPSDKLSLNTARRKPTVNACERLSLIHISEPTRPEPISYAVFCLKKKN